MQSNVDDGGGPLALLFSVGDKGTYACEGSAVMWYDREKNEVRPLVIRRWGKILENFFELTLTGYILHYSIQNRADSTLSKQITVENHEKTNKQRLFFSVTA